MDELLQDEVDILSDGEDWEQYYPEGSWGAADGTTIVSFDPTPSPTPPLDDNNQLSDEKIDDLIIALEENTKALSEEIENEEGSEEELSEEEETEEIEEENGHSIDDIYDQLENIEGILSDINDTSYIHYKNSELILTFVLGFVVAFFAGFIMYCFIGKIK